MLNNLSNLAVRNLFMPLWTIIARPKYLEDIRRLEKNQYRPMAQIRKEQRDKLIRLIQHAYENCPYYRNLFQKMGCAPVDVMENFLKIPILTKDDIRANKEKMLTQNLPCTFIPKKTSGSTGVSLELFMDSDCSEWRRAVTLFRNSWSGWQPGERAAAIWGNPPVPKTRREYLRNILLERCFYLDTLGMRESDMGYFLNQLKRYKPTLMMGHAYSLYYFAKFVEKQSPNYKFNLKGIISTAMMLHPWQREIIEKIFRCRIFERYGCEEVSLIASECEAHKGMHVNTDSLIVEFLKDGHAANEGEESDVVVTDLINSSMPVIRYKIGDKAIYSNTPCPCGRQTPLILKVTGRDADFIMTPDKRIISGISLTENFSLKIPGVEQMQIEQYSINRLKIKIVRDSNFSGHSMQIFEGLCQKTFGPDILCEAEYVNKIPQEKSGKYRFVISHLKKQDLAGNQKGMEIYA